MKLGIPKNKQFSHYGFLAILLIVSGPAFFFKLGFDPDSNIRWFFNYFFANDFSQLSKTVFTQGPLAFLQYPLPIGNNLLIGILYGYLIRAVLLLSIWSVAKSCPHAYLLVAVVYLLCVLISGDTILPLTLLMAMCLAADAEKRWLIPAVLVFLIIWQIRLVPGIMAGAFLTVFLLVQIIKKKESRFFYGALLLAVPVGAMLTDWAIYGNFIGLRYELLFDLIFVGNTPGGAESIPKIELLFSAVLILLLFWQLHLKVKRSTLLVFMLLPALGFFYYATRVGPGTFTVYVKILLVTALLVITVSRSSSLRPYLIGGTLTLLLFYMAKDEHNMDHLPLARLKPALSIRQLIDPGYDFQLYEKQLEIIRKEVDINATFDVYPWNYLPYANKGQRLRPAPILHSYLGNSPKLDSLHAAHFNAIKSPQNLIVHQPLHQGGINGMNMLGQYLPNAEPLTMRTILANYRLHDGVHQKIHPSRSFTHGGGLDIPTNSWFKINLPDGYYYALPEGFTALGNIVYRLEGGEEINFKLNPANVGSGILISPFVYGNNLSEGVNVEAIKIQSAEDVLVHFSLLRLPTDLRD